MIRFSTIVIACLAGCAATQGPTATSRRIESLAKGLIGDGAAAAAQSIEVAARRARPGDAATVQALLGIANSERIAVATRGRFLRLAGTIGRLEDVDVIAPYLHDKKLARDALFALERLPGPTADVRLIAAIEDSAVSPTEVLQALGRRATPAALDALSARASASPAARAALARTGSDAVRTVLEAAYDANQEQGAIAWLAWLAARSKAGKTDGLAAAYRKLLDSRLPHVRLAGLTALARLNQATGRAACLAGLDDADARVRASARAALVRAENAGSWIEAQMKTSPAKRRAELLEVLVDRGDARALPMLEAGASARDAKLATTSLRLLGRFDTETATRILVRAADAGRVGIKQAALTSLAGQLARREVAPVDLVHRILQHSADTATLRTALDLARRLADPKTVPLLARLDGKTELRADLVRTRVAIATGMQDRTAAIDLLQRAWSQATGRASKNEIARGLRKHGVDTSAFALSSGFLPTWFVLGAFPKATQETLATHPFGSKGPDVTRSFDVRGKATRWRKYSTTDVAGVVDLRFLKPSSNCVAYAWCEVARPEAGDATLLVGSDDGVAVWVNGSLVHQNWTSRGVRIDQDRIKTRLRAGKNTILVKVAQGGGDWGFCVRVADAAGKPVDLSR